MKYWNYSLLLSIVSFGMLVLVCCSPGDYTIIVRNDHVIEAGRLFPIMWFIWMLALFAFALNNVFADKCYINKGMQMPQCKKYLPSLLGIPAFISFGWFLYSWFKATDDLKSVAQIFYS